MSSDSFKNDINIQIVYTSYIFDLSIYVKDLALSNLQEFICHRYHPNDHFMDAPVSRNL